MKNFFIPGVSPEQKKKLQEANVAFCDLVIDGEAGLVVDQDNITRSLEIMGAVIVFESATSLEGIVKISLGERSSTRPTVPSPTVTVVSWNGEQQEEFCAIAREILLPLLRRDIVFYVPHGRIVAPESDGRFNIFIWSAPAGQKEELKTPERIWSLGVDCRDSGFRVSGQGVAVIDPETGWAVGELVGNNLFIHHDLCHKGTDREIKIFRHLCEEVVAEVTATPEEKADRQRMLVEAKRVASRELYVKECSRRFEKTVQGTKDAVAKGHADIAKLQQELTKRIRETQGAERKLEQIESFRSENRAGDAREFEELLHVPGVEGVEVADGVIKVFTEHIYITPDWGADTFDIGRFRMEIYTSGSNGGIRFFNLTRQGTGGDYNTNHPHVKKDGSPCLGNIKEMVPQLIGEFEYSAVAQLGLQYLKVVNLEDSVGRGILDHWPKKEKKEAL